MDRRMVIGGYRAAIALLVLFAIAVQIQTNVAAGTFNPTRFFLFFTILSNLFGAVLFLVLAARWGARAARLDFARGASVAYLTVTFIIVIWLLSGADLQVAIPWVDFVLHKLFPVVVLADWLLVPPMQPITFRQGLWWLSFPLAWVAFSPRTRRDRGLVPVPVPESGQRRLWQRRVLLRGDSAWLCGAVGRNRRYRECHARLARGAPAGNVGQALRTFQIISIGQWQLR